jgi:hypothetical protein
VKEYKANTNTDFYSVCYEFQGEENIERNLY